MRALAIALLFASGCSLAFAPGDFLQQPMPGEGGADAVRDGGEGTDEVRGDGGGTDGLEVFVTAHGTAFEEEGTSSPVDQPCEANGAYGCIEITLSRVLQEGERLRIRVHNPDRTRIVLHTTREHGVNDDIFLEWHAGDRPTMLVWITASDRVRDPRSSYEMLLELEEDDTGLLGAWQHSVAIVITLDDELQEGDGFDAGDSSHEGPPMFSLEPRQIDAREFARQPLRVENESFQTLRCEVRAAEGAPASMLHFDSGDNVGHEALEFALPVRAALTIGVTLLGSAHEVVAAEVVCNRVVLRFDVRYVR
jgi:hypothetical protein